MIRERWNAAHSFTVSVGIVHLSIKYGTCNNRYFNSGEDYRTPRVDGRLPDRQ